MSLQLQARSTLIPPLVKHKREIKAIPTADALVTLGIVLPIFAATVLPLSIAYQLLNTGKEAIFGRSIKPWSYEDSGYKVTQDQRKPQKDRSYDVVILGVTGFTGGLAARYMALTYGVGGPVKWAIAGRSQKKLDALKENLSKELRMDNVKNIPTVVVDTAKPETMPALCEDTRVVATTAGPFSFYGSPVVEFCAKFGTHYVDITGEMDWVRHMALMYQDTAQQTGAKLVPFCGHDSIPWDIMVMRMQDTLRKECNDNLQSVTLWDELEGGFAGGTLATAVAVVEGKVPAAPKLDLDVFQRTASGEESAYRVTQNLPVVPERAVSPWEDDTKSSRSKRWTLPFFMADVNANVISWSHALRQVGARSLSYTEKWVQSDFKTAATSYAAMAMVMVSLLNPVTKALVKRYGFTPPGTGPDMKSMEEDHFLQVSGEGIGENGNRVEAIFYLPKDPGCMETVRMMIEASLSLALEGDSLPKRDGGFWPPSVALGNTLVKRILDTGSTLDVRVIPAEKK